MRKRAWLFMLALGAAFAPVTASAQKDYPSKFIRMVAPSQGGGGDFVARLLAIGMSASLGQQVVIDNRGGGVAAGEIVSKSAPDGYTLLLTGQAFWLMPFMRDNLPYDPARDFVPISLLTSSPNVLVVAPNLPVNNVQDLIAFARSKPGSLNYAVGVLGASTHLAAEMFKSMAKLDITRIYYKSMANAWIDMIAGQVQMSFANPSNVVPHIKANRLRALAVTSLLPSPIVPGLPTVASSGLPGYESIAVYALMAPAKVAPALIKRIQEEAARAITKPDVKEKLLNGGNETVGGTSQELADLISRDRNRLGKLIKDAGIRDN